MAQRSFTFCRGSPALSLLGLTGAVAASAFSNLSVFLSCSRSNPPPAHSPLSLVSVISPRVHGTWNLDAPKITTCYADALKFWCSSPQVGECIALGRLAGAFGWREAVGP
ncbi:hypothetical protein ZWY2020_023669 [Hordeum vulgare]|nr:hypothetical protein ZWY2020_023669 [Hordeum vulgare]